MNATFAKPIKRRIAIMLAALIWVPLFAACNTISTASAGQMAQLETRTLKVEGMTCTTCPIQVRKAAERVDGVKSASASLDTGTATVTYDAAKTSTVKIAAAITAIGYPATVATVNPDGPKP